MEIKPLKVTIRELCESYSDNGDNGVFGYGGKLNIRPPYQREFIYSDEKRDKVIATVIDNYPLNVMYWADNGDGTYEVIDGQQRTISICQYINGDFSYLFETFHNLTESQKKKILDYELMVYVCTGDDDERLKWFETINIAGEVLTKQELRNATYAGPFVTDAKRYFSKPNGPAYNIAKNYVNGSPKRQDFLETALKWICYAEGIKDVRYYMDKHKKDTTALPLWNYFNSVINWIESIFYGNKRKSIMKGLDWGKLYEKFKDNPSLDRDKLDKEIAKLIKDSEVENKKGIIPYVLTRDERHLELRTFGDDIKEAVHEEQGGICPICGEHFEVSEMEADHIKPWSKGGKTVKENCQMLCILCNRKKSNK